MKCPKCNNYVDMWWGFTVDSKEPTKCQQMWNCHLCFIIGSVDYTRDDTSIKFTSSKNIAELCKADFEGDRL